MIDIITILDAAKELRYKDLRSVLKWAVKNKVEVFSDENGRKKYMIRNQFEHARLKHIIEFFKKKYKGAWLEAFKSYTNMNLLDVIEMEEDKKNKTFNKSDLKGNHQKDFLKKVGLL